MASGTSIPHERVSSSMSSASCHFSTCPTSSGIWQEVRRATWSGSAFADPGAHVSGRNSRQSTAADAWAEARCKDTPTWQLVTLPAVPVYCRDTQAEAFPSLRNPVSSKIRAFGRIAAVEASNGSTWTQTASKLNHYSGDGDNPRWIVENVSTGTLTRNVEGIAGGLAATTGKTGSTVLQLTNVHGDVVLQLPLDSSQAPVALDHDEYGNARAD